MIAFIKKTYYGFVINTDQLSHNFNRQMTAYVIGVNDGGEEGREYKDLFEEECGEEQQEKNEELVEWITNDNGIECVCSSWNPENKYRDVIFFLKEKPEKDQITKWKERAQNFIVVYNEKNEKRVTSLPEIKILGFELVTFTHNWKTQKL